MPASIAIEHRGTLASRAAIRPRAIFSRKTIAPWSSRPIKCRVFLPVSMPMVSATVACLMGHGDVLLVVSKTRGHPLSGSGREHGRSIPFASVRCCAAIWLHLE